MITFPSASSVSDLLKTIGAKLYGGDATRSGEFVVPRIDTAANWTARNPVLNYLEIGYEVDTGKMKIGNSVTAWASLGYFTPTLDKIPTPVASLDLDNQKIIDLGTPTAATDAVTKAYVDDQAIPAFNNTLLPTGAIAQAYDRYAVPGTNTAGNLTSGTLLMLAVALPKGVLVSSVSFLSGTTAGVALTNQWAVLTDSSRVVLAVSPDGTSAAWGSGTTKTFSFGTPFTTTYSGLHYIGINVTAGTVPNLLGSVTPAFVNGVEALVPIVCATANTGLTSPLSLAATTAALTATRFKPYFYVS